MHEFKRNIPIHHKRSLTAYFWIALSILVVYAFLGKLTPQRVGDGNEYYALFLAWKETFRPWMTDTSYRAFQELYLQHTITGLMPADWLQNAFPELRLRNESDFNHFWLYSFLAFSIARVSQLLGLGLTPHSAFLGLHYLLVTGVSIIAYHLYGRRGILAIILMTVFSPMLWFSDKVHTEFFTYCLTLAGVMLTFSRKYVPAAFFLAIASTQNPSFALIAFVPFSFRFFLEKTRNFTAFEVILTISTVLAVLAHPVYYFLRYGVPTPQLLAGGAALGGKLSIFYIWILDPDLGLLPNWPLGALLVLFSLCIWRSSTTPATNTTSHKYFYLFSVIFLAVNFYAHSSTTNLNSGATPGLARYSLWYLPIFFPLVYYVICNFSSRKWVWYPAALAITLTGCASIIVNNPKKPESYSTPTWFSNAIQTKLPWLYTPPEEVFAERYSGLGEGIYQYPVRGVLGPDCHKLLVLPGESKDIVTIPSHCLIDAQNLGALINETPPPSSAKFIRLSDSQYTQASLKLKPQTYHFGSTGNGNFSLVSGWHSLEDWGVWSSEKIATLSLPCNPEQYYFKSDKLELDLNLHGFGRQKITIIQNKKNLFQGPIEAQNEIPLILDVDECRKGPINIKILINKPVSPADIGLSEDQRTLGVGIVSFALRP